MSVYRLIFELDTVEEAEAMVKKIGVTEPLVSRRLQNGSRIFTAMQGNMTFMCRPDDGQWYWVNDDVMSLSSPTNLPPDEETCKQIAVKEVERLGINKPEDISITLLGGDAITFGAPGGVQQTYMKNRQIALSRKLDGYVVIGPSMRTTVYVCGMNGQIGGVDSTMRKAVKAGSYQTKTEKEAIEDAKAGRGTINLHAEVKNPTVNKIVLMYYADPAKPENEYIQPVYCLTGPNLCIYVPAIK